jgi:hypothetical protein
VEWKRRLFLRIFQAEIDDLQDEIHAVEEIHRRRLEQKEITGYVFQENFAILQKEILALQDIVKEIDVAAIADCRSLEECAQRVESIIRREIEELEAPEHVFHLASRKVRKILRYMTIPEA